MGLRPHRRRGAVAARELGGEADDLQRILEIVHDRAGEAANDREPLGLDDLAEVFVVQRAHPVVDVAADLEREPRLAVEQPEKFLAVDETRLGVDGGARGGGAGRVVEDGHLADGITGAKRGEHPRLGAVSNRRGNFDVAGFNEIKTVARIARGKNNLTRAKTPGPPGVARQAHCLAEQLGEMLFVGCGHLPRT